MGGWCFDFLFFSVDEVLLWVELFSFLCSAKKSFTVRAIKLSIVLLCSVFLGTNLVFFVARAV